MQAGQNFHNLSDNRALLPYALLGLVAGLLSALAVLAFEWQIQALGYLWLGSGSPDDFESLPGWQRFAIPVGVAAVLGIVFNLLSPEDRETGIVHVLTRMHGHYGKLPLRNALVQFFGGAVALAGGHSGGREGPGVQLGAAISSWLSDWLQLPNNSQRLLIACGTAGSIAAAFNTPLAGVVFAMEVIVAEYTVIGFTPVLLAAISATTLSKALGGGFIGFAIPEVSLTSLLELPLILLLGVAAGVMAGSFAKIIELCLRAGRFPPLVRFLAAGVLTGALGLLVPEALGLGYDSLEDALRGNIGALALGMLLGAKLIATAVTVGLGLPVGVIGPSLIMGSCVGGLVGFAGMAAFPEYGSHPSLYVVIGMGAGMAAILNAPLAALLGVVELTGNVSVVFPTMLAIVAATLTNTVGLRALSAHRTVLRYLQRAIPEDPISQLLHQTNVITAMDRSICALDHCISAEAYNEAARPNWCLLKREEEHLFLVQGADVAAILEAPDSDTRVDLLEQDLRRWSMTTVSLRATLREALDAMRRADAEAVVVLDTRVAGDLGIRGVLTRDIIDQFYLMRL
ncbi:MAG: chloride channel protein [Halieaceae bacterium]|nr:chloride channel protein [Halieaceae bacterium]